MFLNVLAIAVAGYLALVAGTVVFQRSLIYFPSAKYQMTPADFGLPWEETMLEAADGVKVCAWYVPGPAPDSPVVLYLHGNACNLGSLPPLACDFREAGFAFMAVDYRGYGKSAGTPTEDGLYRDAKAARDWLGTRGVPPGRILIWGQSLGAAVAAWLAANGDAAGVVLEGAFPSLYRSARHHYPFILVPESALRDRYPTAANAARARCPVLVVHGERDAIAPPVFGREIFAAAREPRMICAVPGAGHNDLTPLHPAVKRALEEFRRLSLARGGAGN